MCFAVHRQGANGRRGNDAPFSAHGMKEKTKFKRENATAVHTEILKAQYMAFARSECRSLFLTLVRSRPPDSNIEQ